MKAGNILAPLVRPDEFRNDGVKVEGSRVDKTRPGGHQARISGGTIDPA